MNIYLSENKEFLHFFQDGKKVYLKNINNIKYSTRFSFPTYIIEMPNGNEFTITPKIDDLFNLCIPYATEKQKEGFALILLQKLKEVLC